MSAMLIELPTNTGFGLAGEAPTGWSFGGTALIWRFLVTNQGDVFGRVLYWRGMPCEVQIWRSYLAPQPPSGDTK